MGKTGLGVYQLCAKGCEGPRLGRAGPGAWGGPLAEGGLSCASAGGQTWGRVGGEGTPQAEEEA